MHGEVVHRGRGVAHSHAVRLFLDAFQRQTEGRELLVLEGVHRGRSAHHHGEIAVNVLLHESEIHKSVLTAFFLLLGHVHDLELAGHLRRKGVEPAPECEIGSRLCPVEQRERIVVGAVRKRLRHAVEGSDAAAARDRNDLLRVLDRLVAEITGRIAYDKLVARLRVVEEPFAEKSRFLDGERGFFRKRFTGRGREGVGTGHFAPARVAAESGVLTGAEVERLLRFEDVRLHVRGFEPDFGESRGLVAGVEDLRRFVHLIGRGQRSRRRFRHYLSALRHHFLEAQEVHKSENLFLEYECHKFSPPS